MIRDLDVTETNPYPHSSTPASGQAPASANPVRKGGAWPTGAIAPNFPLNAYEWGMIAFLISEVSLFSTLIVTYLSFLGRDTVGPSPAEALSLLFVIFTTLCLLSSSVTIHKAEKALKSGDQARFRRLWGATIALGIIFLLGTAYEWRELIVRYHLTIDRNLFGTTYYTLVGFHGLHVTLGVVTMLVVLGLVLAHRLSREHELAIKLVSWYWHFVDAVWVVVFTVVYVLGR